MGAGHYNDMNAAIELCLEQIDISLAAAETANVRSFLISMRAINRFTWVMHLLSYTGLKRKEVSNDAISVLEQFPWLSNEVLHCTQDRQVRVQCDGVTVIAQVGADGVVDEQGVVVAASLEDWAKLVLSRAKGGQSFTETRIYRAIDVAYEGEWLPLITFLTKHGARLLWPTFPHNGKPA